MLGFDGFEMNDGLKEAIERFWAGGIILFRYNIASPEQLKQLCADAQALAKSLGRPPLFIAVDQEGGTVARLRAPFTEFPGNPHIHSRKEAEAFARVTAAELSAGGINMNLAPVLDMVPPGAESIMEKRAFPGDADQVSVLGGAVIDTLQENGVMAVAKHFPGIGRTVLDSHHTLPVLDIDTHTLESNDMVPFRRACDQGVAGVMLSHIMFPQQDPHWQASLSPIIAKKMLREKLNYQGLLLTDDLDMKAISHDMETCVRQIFLADIDLTLICHRGPDMERAFTHMIHLMESETNFRDMGRISVDRILAMKKVKLGT